MKNNLMYNEKSTFLRSIGLETDFISEASKEDLKKN